MNQPAETAEARYNMTCPDCNSDHRTRLILTAPYPLFGSPEMLAACGNCGDESRFWADRTDG